VVDIPRLDCSIWSHHCTQGDGKKPPTREGKKGPFIHLIPVTRDAPTFHFAVKTAMGTSPIVRFGGHQQGTMDIILLMADLSHQQVVRFLFQFVESASSTISNARESTVPPSQQQWLPEKISATSLPRTHMTSLPRTQHSKANQEHENLESCCYLQANFLAITSFLLLFSLFSFQNIRVFQK